MAAPKIVVHWLDDSRAQRILWLLEELGLTYEVKRYIRDTKTNLAPPELYDVHPTGKSPVVTITDNGKTFTLAESGAITEFIIERYGERLGLSASSSDPQERAEYLYWLHYAEGSAMGPLMFSLVFTQIGLQAPWVARPIVNLVTGAAMSQFGLPRLKAMFKHVEASLEGKEYFVGNRLTGADVMMSFIAEGLAATPLDVSRYPNLTRWHEAIMARPAYAAAEAKGGKNNMDRFVK
ncbi:uncharacterized protein RHOBADRAFT_52456 [Rhodotorula graminis WP1]|uniref:glutathione transferase n=1 Tax=Rhodotorula graminis (strain WP1) TaxID=578459 RepID=A0A194S6U6_RHOGW|nr:uncharacterized protein RHOBADRAFT_52456 [Rhodotorula graminis WP1]KPV76448.1 hypothetical protein RHOBADRAFT_52456 [Rhodotorula graminis WP1]